MRAFFDFPALLRLDHFLGHPIELFQHNRLATHSGHEREDERTLWAFVERRAHLGVERAAAAHAAEPHVGFDHAYHLEFAEDVLDALGRVGPDRPQPNEADLRAAVTHVPNRVT